jgi:hypothetical protein
MIQNTATKHALVRDSCGQQMVHTFGGSAAVIEALILTPPVDMKRKRTYEVREAPCNKE